MTSSIGILFIFGQKFDKKYKMKKEGNLKIKQVCFQACFGISSQYNGSVLAAFRQ